MCYNGLGDTMKKIIYILILVIITGTILYFRNHIANYLTNEVVIPDKKNEPVSIKSNDYKYEDWEFVKNISDFTAYKYEDFNNIFYTILNQFIMIISSKTNSNLLTRNIKFLKKN